MNGYAFNVYGELIHRHVKAARKDFDGKDRQRIFDLIEAFRVEFPEECRAWDACYTPREPDQP